MAFSAAAQRAATACGAAGFAASIPANGQDYMLRNGHVWHYSVYDHRPEFAQSCGTPLGCFAWPRKGQNATVPDLVPVLGEHQFAPKRHTLLKTYGPHHFTRWYAASQAHAARLIDFRQSQRSSKDSNDVTYGDGDEEDRDISEEDDDEYFDDDDEGGDFDDEDQFDAENGAEESVLGEQPAVSTSGRNLPRMQAVGFEKQRTKRNYEPDQDDEDFFAQPWTDEDQILHRKYLVNFGRFTSEKWLPLHTAAACGQVANIKYLVQQGVDINGLDRDGFTPLHKAVMNVRDAAVRQLLRLGAKALLVDQDGASLLHYACQAGNVSICKMLLRARVPINQKDNDGWTPLHIAAQSGQRPTIRTLLMNGADPKARNRDDLTAYDLLKAYGQGFGYAPAKKLLAKPPNRRDLLTGRVR